MKLDHNFVFDVISQSGLFSHMKKDGIFVESKCTVANFAKAADEQANSKDNFIGMNTANQPLYNVSDVKTYVGDAFEMLCEMVILDMGHHPLIGISNYKLIQTNDYGVDGWGTCTMHGHSVTVQCKYRSDPSYLLTASADGLDSFFAESIAPPYLITPTYESSDKSAKWTGPKRMIVMTTADDIYYKTKEIKHRNAMRCIGVKWFNDNIDHNLMFWKKFEEVLLTS